MQALDVARAAGLDLRQSGSRWWSLCPFHAEKSASFCIFPDGRWYCFGCQAHGDAADLYATLYDVTLGEALRAVKGEAWRPKPRKPSGNDLRRVVEKWKSEQWHRACLIYHAAQAVISFLRPESALCWKAIGLMAEAQDELNALESADPKQLVKWMVDDAKQLRN